MGAGLRITTVIVLFAVLYILFGVVYSFLTGTNISGEFSTSVGNAFLLAVSWPAFVYLLGNPGGQIGYFIASAIILAIIVLLLWVAYLINNLIFLREHKKNESEDRYERLKKAHEEYLINKKEVNNTNTGNMNKNGGIRK